MRRATIGGIGETLRAERERLHVSLDAVERGTLIRRDFLELIDADRLAELPSGAYAKGFIRAYAAFLGIDAAPLVRAYEEHYAQPEPELARVVRRGLRVPPDLQRRARTVAVVGAIGVLALLALFGVFRSDGSPEEVPRAQAAVARVPEVVRNPMGATLTVTVIGEASWIEVEADGQRVFGETLGTGETRSFKATERIALYLARAREFSITSNGRILGSPDLDSYKAVFTPSTFELPPNDLTSAASGAEPAPESAG